MSGGMVAVPRRLWRFTQTAAVANERVAGIVGRNPRLFPVGLMGAVFHFRCTAKNNITLGNVIIYGTIDAEGSTPQFFPSAGAGLQFALAYSTANLGAGGGILCVARVPTGFNAADGGVNNNFVAAPVIPNGLILEYNTSAPGAGPTITVEVWVIAAGPGISDRS